ncbi:MAG: hypothetical protein WD271_08335 [Acidimicrobiia bacterium]
MTFDPRLICAALEDEGVRFVLIGGFAATIHGSPLPTSDIDIVPARDDENLERLARALVRLHARLRTEGGPVDVRIDAGFLRAMPFILNLVTDYGDIDLTFSPAGRLDGFDGWDEGAIEAEIGPGLVVRIAALDDIIDSKRTAGRPKDDHALPYLESLRDEILSQRKDRGP